MHSEVFATVLHLNVWTSYYSTYERQYMVNENNPFKKRATYLKIA